MSKKPFESRDPIMKDGEFSLRYGNPIKVIHDVEMHKVDTFEPTKNHVSSTLANTISEAIHQNHRPTVNSNAGALRDTTICSEFYHTKYGTVTEIGHEQNKNT